jgi:hypothetical protein
MDDFPCQRLSGRMNLRIMYGRPGNEKFEMIVKGTVDVIMERFGFASHIMLSPQS